MTDELKSQITALRTAIMRRVEFDQCIHASSIEDEIGKWVREVLEPKPIPVKKAQNWKPGDVHNDHMLTVKPNGVYEWKPVYAVEEPRMAWSGYAEKMVEKVADRRSTFAETSANALVRAAENQRLAQALAQQKFNQQIGNLGVGIGGAGLSNYYAATAAEMIVGRETNAVGQIIEVVAKSDGTTYRRYA